MEAVLRLEISHDPLALVFECDAGVRFGHKGIVDDEVVRERSTDRHRELIESLPADDAAPVIEYLDEDHSTHAIDSRWRCARRRAFSKLTADSRSAVSSPRSLRPSVAALKRTS